MRKRSSYRPRPVLVDPLGYVLESMKPITDHESYLVDLKLRNHAALTLLLKGQAAKQEINDLLAAHNATLGLVKTLNYPDDTYIMQRSHSALQGVVARFAEVGRYVLRGSEMAALNEMISLHDEFLDHVTVRQMEEALAYIKRNTHTAVRLT